MMRKSHRPAAVLLALCLLFAVLGAAPGYAAESRPQTVRVGYFAFDGYHNLDSDGTRSGYGYEYLQQMARYTGWSYDYLGYDKSWSEAQQMLEDGKIDLLTSAQKTPEREDRFDFSAEPIGYSSTIFTIKAGNDKYTIDDYAGFAGIRVGMIEGNSRNEDFSAFAADKGFSYVPVMFADMAGLVSALQTGEIDAIVTSSLRVTNGEWIVAEFSFSPYYVCVQKGNQALLDQVNDAIGKINQNNPSLQNELEDKYYGTDSGNNIPFTEEERAYISDIQSSGRKLRLMINPDRFPLSAYEDGELAGIFGEVASTLLERAGLPYEVVPVADRGEYAALRDAHAVDLCMDMRFDYNQAEVCGYRITDSYYTATVSRITRKEMTGEPRSVAAIKDSDLAARLEKLVDGLEIVYYATGQECVDAVKSGAQDAAFLYTYVAEKALENDITHPLTATLVPDFSTSFCIGVGDMGDTVLFSILNKSVSSLGSEQMDRITLSYTNSDVQTVSLLELLYYHPVAAVIVVAAFLLILGGAILLLFRQAARRKDAERAKEIQRLFSYVCSANESVLEVNLDKMSCKEYFFADGAFCTQKRPYATENNAGALMAAEDYAEIEKTLTPEALDKLIRLGGETVFEARGKGKDGVYRWYIYTIHGMVPDKTHPRSFMLFKRNIDDLKRKEEETQSALRDALKVAKEASEAKGSFMSRMSHEIRTPLNAVIGYLTLMQDAKTNPEKIEDYIGKCQSASRHLLNIINDVLDISAIESGKIKISSEPFDLKELLSSISLMFYGQAKKKGVVYRTELVNLTEELVVGDQLRLNQILMNLLSNAMKFTPEGGSVQLTVEQLQIETSRVWFRFQVSDTGIGMSKAFMARIFSPFEQEKAETARKYGGSGLGLSITNNLITMMQGSIKVDSEEGRGTTFTVHLAFGQAAPSKRAGSAAPRDFSKIRALIVDDESRSCDYMKALLKRCKVKSDVVLSGEEAIRQIMRREGTDYEYDLCLIDWNMPGLNGVDTAARIRSECKKDMPIIIATAYDISEIRDTAIQAGVNKLIAKPLFQSSMFDLLVDTFGKYDAVPEIASDAQAMDFSGIRVLLAEDNAMNLEIAVSILGKSGLRIDTAADGRQAYEAFLHSEPGTYQVILMDIQMPVMDGYEATRAIRESAHPQAKTIPIIAMTANAFTEDVTAALACGMNDHLSKPINYDKLYQLLKKYLGGKAEEE